MSCGLLLLLSLLVTLMKSKGHCDNYDDFFFLGRVKELLCWQHCRVVGTQIN